MPRKPSQTRGHTITLPWHIYRHYPADFSRWREAAAGFRGWDSELRELDLDRTCLDRIARYKRPKEYHFVEALPTNNYGKVLKRELRQRFTDGPPPQQR